MRHLLTFIFALALIAPPMTVLAQPNQPAENGTPITQTPQPTENESSGYEFVPLTNLPDIQALGSEDSMSNFFNSLYKLCIGAAAVIAVLQIMRAGTKLFFNTGSVTQNQEAKNLIRNSLLGLLLVLSPAIVFSIINPDILNLDLDVERIKLDELEQVNLQSSNDIGTGGFAALFGRVNNITVEAAQLRTGIQVTVTAAGMRDGNVTPEDLVEGDRERAAAFIRSCQESGGSVKINTGARNGCPNNTATCTGNVRCDFPQQTQTPTQNNQPTNTIANSQYEWRIQWVRGGTIVRQPYGRRHPSQTECQSALEAEIARVNREQPTWNLNGNYTGCNCSQPRTAFPACRQ